MLTISELKEVNIGKYVEKYTWALNVFLLMLLALVTANMTNTWVRSSYASTARAEVWTGPALSSGQAVASYKVDTKGIEERNLFAAKIREEVIEEEAAAQETNLNICIQGIISGPKWKFATIQNLDDKKVKVCGLGETIAQGATIADILPDRIVIARRSGRTEETMLDYSANRCAPGAAAAPRPTRSTPPEMRRTPFEGGQPPSPGGGEGVQAISETEFVIDRGEFDAHMNNLNDLVTKARMVPNFTPDRQVDGFRIFQIVPGSIFQKLGMRNGDVIQQVNGVRMDDPTKGLELFQALRNQSHFTIDLKRMNQRVTNTYEVR